MAPETIERFLGDDVEALNLFEEATTRSKGGQPGNQNAKAEKEETNSDNITIRSPLPAPKRGTSCSYAARRLARDAPELFERVKRGELSAPWMQKGPARYARNEPAAQRNVMQGHCTKCKRSRLTPSRRTGRAPRTVR
jgi:hypothetical protein